MCKFSSTFGVVTLRYVLAFLMIFDHSLYSDSFFISFIATMTSLTSSIYFLLVLHFFLFPTGCIISVLAFKTCPGKSMSIDITNLYHKYVIEFIDFLLIPHEGHTFIYLLTDHFHLCSLPTSHELLTL